MRRFRPMLLDHEVTEQQWRVLRVLSEFDGMDAGDLAEHACILAPSLSRISKALEARGLILVSRDPVDGRRSIIRLTQQGFDFIRVVAPISGQIYAELEGKVGRERIETLLDELDALILELAPEK